MAYQEERKLRKQDVKAALTWMISLGHTESGTEVSPSFVIWKTTANSAAVKSPEILIGVAVGVHQQSDTSFETSPVE